MSRIDELIERLCPDGIPFRTIDSLVQVVPAPKKIHRSDYLEQGAYPVIDQGTSLIAAKTNDSSALVDVGACVLFGDHTRTIKFYTKPFAQGADGLKILVPHKSILPRYLFHAMKAASIPNRGYSRHWSMAKAVLIPIPPMEIQEEIVRILDSFSELEAELEAELDNRIKQYRFFRNRLLNSDSSSPACNFKLGEVVSINKGTYITKREVSPGKIPVVLGGTEPAYWHAEANHLGEGIVVSRSGANAGFVSYWNEPIFVSDGFVLDSKPGISLRYIYHALKNKQDKLHAMKRGSGVPHIQRKALSEFVISIPPLEEQRRIVSILDKFDALVNDFSSGIPAEIEARRKQYEYYRDKLLTFKEKPGD